MKPKLPLLLLKTFGCLLLATFLFSSCAYYDEMRASEDFSQQKQGSTGGSSQSTKSNSGLNFEEGWEFTPLGIRFPTKQSALLTEEGGSYFTDRSTLSGFKIRVGAGFIQKGGKLGSGDTKITTTFNYIKLPISFRYQQVLADNSRWSAGLGPYFAYGIGGKTKVTTNGQTIKTKVFDVPLTGALMPGLPLAVNIACVQSIIWVGL